MVSKAKLTKALCSGLLMVGSAGQGSKALCSRCGVSGFDGGVEVLQAERIEATSRRQSPLLGAFLCTFLGALDGLALGVELFCMVFGMVLVMLVLGVETMDKLLISLDIFFKQSALLALLFLFCAVLPAKMVRGESKRKT